jgi:AraC family transcriptional regulator, ethanolamine operon transcriptional activator
MLAAPGAGTAMDSMTRVDTPSGLNDPSDAAVNIYKPISCTDAAELSPQVQDWNFEFTQLSAGPFAASGGILLLDSVHVARVTYDQSLLQRGYAPRGSVTIAIPSRGSGQLFVGGRQLQSSQCLTLADGACLEGITRGRYVDVEFAIDLNAWETQSHWLRECPLARARGIGVETPSPLWINHMLETVEWTFNAFAKHPEALRRPDVRASLRDQFLMRIGSFGDSTNGTQEERHTSDARARRRIAVERAREYIELQLTEPLPLSELCRHAHVQARSLEYGFREITGLSPITYIKSLRLNAVRKTLLNARTPERSISEVALDYGFWHLSQFAVDYRKFFGETPTATRRRVLRGSAHRSHPHPARASSCDLALFR